MRWWRVWLLLGVVAVSGCAGAGALDPRQARFEPLQFTPPQPTMEHLSGGVPLFLLEDHDLPLVRVWLGFRGGSLYDPPDQAGLAAVTGPAWRTGGSAAYTPEGLDEALEDRAIKLSVSLGRGISWATLSVLTPELDPALDLLEELLLRPSFREQRVEWARTQAQERLRREVDDPQALAFREFRRAAYSGHPRGVVASVASVARVTRNDVVGLHRRLLSESAWVIGAVGDFDARQLRDELERRFGHLPSSATGFPRLPAPAALAPQVVLVPRDLPQATVVWGRLGPSRLDPESYALELVDYVVGASGFQSRLVREIRSNRGLAYSVGSYYQALPEFGVLGTFARVRADAVLETNAVTREIIDAVAGTGVTSRELAEAKEAMANRYVFRYQDPGSVVRERLTLELQGLPADLPGRYLPGVEAVDLAAALHAARWYSADTGVTVVVGPLAAEDLRRPGGPPVKVVDQR